jgi:hypothetical protein
MVVTLVRIYDMHSFVATGEPVLNEWKQYAILFLVIVKKSADMSNFAKLGAGEGNRGRGLIHGVVLSSISCKQVLGDFFQAKRNGEVNAL